MRREVGKNSGRYNGKEERSENEVVEQEEEGDTRCICEEIDPPDDSGLYIQCEGCSVWQHGYCVGITEGETPDKYWCEECKPELHSIYTTELKERRSHYKPIQQRRRKVRRNKRSSEDEDEVGVLDGSQQTSQKLINGYGVVEQEADTVLNGGDMDTIDALNEEGQKTSDRKRATSSAREEKHYQLMLEKALRESRRTSNDGISGNEDGVASQMVVDNVSQPVVSGTTRKDTESPDNNTLEGIEAGTQSRKRGRTAAANKSTSPSESEEETKLKRVRRSKTTPSTTSTKLQKNGERLGRGGGRSAKSHNGNISGHLNSNHSISGNSTSLNSEITIHKPLKPRIPSQRTTLNEMRKRVTAILEFISRTQLELSEDKFQRDQFCQFVENRKFLSKLDDIFKNYDESYKKMDELTRQLLLWEQKFSAAI